MRLLGVLFVLALAVTALALPVNVSVTAGTARTLTSSVGSGTVGAWGGNVTSVNVVINSSTLRWQGFYGNVTGNLALGAGTNVLKTWNIGTLKGQVFVSTGGDIDFTALNSTAVTLANVDSTFTFLSGAPDSAVNTGVNNTCNSDFNVSYYNVPFESKPCIKTQNSSGTAIWETVVLRDATTTTATDYVFVGIIRENQTSFDGTPADFQIMVPENALGNVAPTNYYFYGEVQ